MTNSTSQYCYTLPSSYCEFEHWDNTETTFHVDKDYNAGNTVKFSKVCSNDWYLPGTDFVHNGVYRRTCENLHWTYCNWQIPSILLWKVPSPDGYVTPLNCAACGCTPGQNDVVTMQELESSARTAGDSPEQILAQIEEELKVSLD